MHYCYDKLIFIPPYYITTREYYPYLPITPYICRKTKKTPTVITLSSDESEPEADKPLTGYDDTTAFVGGMHTDDTKNVPDSQGRVLVNVNHPPDEPDIFLTPKLAETVKSHQVTS